MARATLTVPVTPEMLDAARARARVRVEGSFAWTPAEVAAARVRVLALFDRLATHTRPAGALVTR